MRQILKYAGYILVLLIAGFLVWKFYFILGWILIAAVLSFMGEPIVRTFDRIHFKKFHMPHWVGTLLALLCIVLVFIGLLSLFVPLIIKESQNISKIDLSNAGDNIMGPIGWIENKMRSLGAISPDQTIQDFITAKVKLLTNFRILGSFLGVFVSTAGNLMLTVFAILFITFFFLKDENMFEDGLLLLIPEKHHVKTRIVVSDSKKLLKRYFIGVSLEITIVVTLLSLGLTILGIANPLTIGFFGGIMNIIPYLGPIIGTVVGVVLGVIGFLASGSTDQMLPVLLKLLCVFLVVNFTDGHVLQPIIYSRSIKSHPLEVFLIIIIGNGLAGLPGMLLAVPVYTIMRVIAKEFFQEFRVVKKLTETMDQ
jgi:predicted PurR-regulated permease PerM